ncbi:MAG: TonB-dependent receptor plug domain-containing protein [Opitutaceae bacterium]
MLPSAFFAVSRTTRCVSLGLILPGFLTAQVASPITPHIPITATAPVIVLKPFEVSTDPDDGCDALRFSSLSGTNRSLEKLPVTAEILNATRLADLAVTDVVDMLNKYATGIGPGEPSPGTSSATGTQDGDRFALGSFSVRGLDAGPVRRNGFLSAGNLGEAFATERMEIIRGPQSLLFGAGSTGGVINVTTRKALFRRTFFRPTARVDSLGSQRFELDANVYRKALNRQIALRLGVVNGDQNFWRELLNRETKGYYGELAVELLPATSTLVRFEVEDRISEGVEAQSRATVSGIPTLVPNNSVLSVLLANKSPAKGWKRSLPPARRATGGFSSVTATLMARRAARCICLSSTMTSSGPTRRDRCCSRTAHRCACP